MVHHPDREFGGRLMNYLDYGAPIFYEGDECARVCDNWKTADVFKDDVVKSIANDVKLGMKIGPFQAPPMENYVGSPMGVFEKTRSGRRKVRIIHDLSWPPKESINAHIRGELCSVK
jgi:hypothetical protein